jgi:hypothetical protein
MSKVDNPHFGNGHMCAGCQFAGTLHTGCVTGENVRVLAGEVQVYKKQRVSVEDVKIEMVKSTSDSPEQKQQ